jgi:hypothetical protein
VPLVSTLHPAESSRSANYGRASTPSCRRNDGPAPDIAEIPHGAYLNEDRAVLVSPERHPGFKQDVGPRLPGQRRLPPRIGLFFLSRAWSSGVRSTTTAEASLKARSKTSPMYGAPFFVAFTALPHSMGSSPNAPGKAERGPRCLSATAVPGPEAKDRDVGTVERVGDPAQPQAHGLHGVEPTPAKARRKDQPAREVGWGRRSPRTKSW